MTSPDQLTELSQPPVRRSIFSVILTFLPVVETDIWDLTKGNLEGTLLINKTHTAELRTSTMSEKPFVLYQMKKSETNKSPSVSHLYRTSVPTLETHQICYVMCYVTGWSFATPVSLLSPLPKGSITLKNSPSSS